MKYMCSIYTKQTFSADKFHIPSFDYRQDGFELSLFNNFVCKVNYNFQTLFLFTPGVFLVIRKFLSAPHPTEFPSFFCFCNEFLLYSITCRIN